MKIIETMMTKNPCYKAGRKIVVKGLMLHSVGCPQPSAQVFVNRWNKPSYSSACVHGFIDANTGTVYQTLPWNHRGWHGGRGKNGSCNNMYIGIEMCEPSCIKYTKRGLTCSDIAKAKTAVRRTYIAAVELFAYLCKKYDLNPLDDGVILSHKEGCARGIATNHGDPEHLWNALGIGYTMDGFRNDVKKAMNTESEELTMTQYEELKAKDATHDKIINTVGQEIKDLKTKTKYYNKLSEVPEWYRSAVDKMIARGGIEGDDNGNLMLTTDMMRMFTALEKIGVI